MATKKELITIGQKLRVTNKGTGINGPLVLAGTGGPLASGIFYPPVGAELEIAGKPYKDCGSKIVPILYEGHHAESYYCMVRYSTEPVQGKEIIVDLLNPI